MKTKTFILALIASMIALVGCTNTSSDKTTPQRTQQTVTGVSPTNTPLNSVVSSTVNYLTSSFLPKDKLIPLYPGVIPDSVIRSSEKNKRTTTFSFHTDASEQKVRDFYDQQLPTYGWILGSTINIFDAYFWQSPEPDVSWDLEITLYRDRSTETIRLAKFPKLEKIPVYPGSKIETQTDKTEGRIRTITIIYHTDKSFMDIAKYYAEEMPTLGWDDWRSSPYTGIGSARSNNIGVGGKSLLIKLTPENSTGTLVMIEAKESSVASDVWRSPEPTPALIPTPMP